MSKESIKASIERVKGQIAQRKLEIANIRSRKKEASERYSADIKNAKTASLKESRRNYKASVMANYESQIRTAQGFIASLQREMASLKARLKTEK